MSLVPLKLSHRGGEDLTGRDERGVVIPNYEDKYGAAALFSPVVLALLLKAVYTDETPDETTHEYRP